MSLIFDALQRSGTEQSGVEYPDMVSVATEVFEALNQQIPADSEKAAVFQTPDAVLTPPQKHIVRPKTPPVVVPPERTTDLISKFPSLQVSVASNKRLVFSTEPDSLAAEKFRFLGVRLRQLRHNRTLKKVLITSTIPGEGKSLISANVAGVLARRKEKVLLLEGDLRRPVLAQQFCLGKLAGLGEWLQSNQQTPSNIYHLDGAGFWLMPAGVPPANPLELMQSGKLSQLLTDLSDLFDWIIVDSPPLLPLADTTVLGRLTDGTLLVVREGITEKDPLQRGLEAIRKSDMLGVVLNGCTGQDHDNYYAGYLTSPKK